MSWRIRALIVTFAGAGLLIAPSEMRWAADATTARAAEAAVEQDQGEGPAPSLLSAFVGGPVRAKRARTQTTATSIASPGFWRPLLNATLVHAVPTGTSDLFNVAFSAECQKLGGGTARIRILDNGVALQPYDGAQSFCTSTLPATHKGNWVRRVGAGTHTLVVQFFNTAGSVVIDDWTFEVVVYD